MADSRNNRRYGDWSEIVNELFNKIAIRLDINSAVRLAACSKDFYRQVARSRCPNDFCWKLVAHHKVPDHKIACPHRPCPCTEPGCEFAAPPPALLAHLIEAHSMEMHSFHYGKIVRYNSQPVLAPGSRRVQIFGSGDDGTVFAVQFDTCNNETLVSVVCVRSAACLSPRYKVRLWTWFMVDSPMTFREVFARWPGEVDAVEVGKEEMEALWGFEQIKALCFSKEFEPTSSASPEELRNSMDVDWEFLRIQEP